MSGRLGFRLLVEVCRTPFASNAELGRRLGVTGEAVRQRLARFTEDGVLRGFSALPAASVFGRRGCDLIYPPFIDLDLLLRQPDVLYVVRSVDGRCGVKGYVQDASAFTSHLNDLVGVAPLHANIEPTGPTDVLSSIDLRVLRALVAEPRSSLRRLQDATGLSYRTVRSRRQHLVDTGAVAVQPILRPSRSGELYHNLWIQGPACRDEQAVLALLEEHILIDRWPSPPSLYLFCHERGLEAHVTMIETLRRTPGIDNVEVLLNKEYRLAEDRVLGWIDERLATWRGQVEVGSRQQSDLGKEGVPAVHPSSNDSMS